MKRALILAILLAVTAAVPGSAAGQENPFDSGAAAPASVQTVPSPPPAQPQPVYQPPAQPQPVYQPPPPPARPAAPEARTIDAYQGPAPAGTQPAAEQGGAGAPQASGFPGKLAAGAFLSVMKGAGPETGLVFRGWPHEMLGLQASFGVNAWAYETGAAGEQTSTAEISPAIRIMLAFLRTAASRMYVAANGGPLLVKPAGEDLGAGLQAGLDLGIETLLIKDSGAALDVAGGVTYYSYKAAALGNGVRSHFTLGFNYYF
ncbi:MAG: hypothetical protein HY897_02750 [Deltaproteobacteria bacterium]|nr:hypothetical protein [Deltaproteobacteria bacterium]